MAVNIFEFIEALPIHSKHTCKETHYPCSSNNSELLIGPTAY